MRVTLVRLKSKCRVYSPFYFSFWISQTVEKFPDSASALRPAKPIIRPADAAYITKQNKQQRCLALALLSHQSSTRVVELTEFVLRGWQQSSADCCLSSNLDCWEVRRRELWVRRLVGGEQLPDSTACVAAILLCACQWATGGEDGHSERPLLRLVESEDQPGGGQAAQDLPLPSQMLPLLRHLLPHRWHHPHLDGSLQPSERPGEQDGFCWRTTHTFWKPLGNV